VIASATVSVGFSVNRLEVMIFFVVMRHRKEDKTPEYPATCGGAD
jgi:hypothetical protein